MVLVSLSCLLLLFLLVVRLLVFLVEFGVLVVEESEAVDAGEEAGAKGPIRFGADGRPPVPCRAGTMSGDRSLSDPLLGVKGSQVQILSSRLAKLQVAGRFRFWRERPF
ncbi:hypothetical protein UK12_30535 [Saccharothrix sp. ST-888]|nr:hypothetical protein UK12_30535 [Saccharothrix sp. ST-888]